MSTGLPPTPTKTDAENRFDEARRIVGIVAGPLVFLLVLAWPFGSLTPEGHRLAAVMGLVIVFWITEALPLPVTALLGPTLAVVLRVAPVSDTFRPFASPTIFLFIGSFILAQALFVHRVNERVAFGVLSLRVIGARPTRILIAYGALAAFLSAWMSNTATAAMLVPIGLSAHPLHGVGGGHPQEVRHCPDADDDLLLLAGRHVDSGRGRRRTSSRSA